MKLTRERWVVFRRSDNRIFCGKARAYEWRSLEEIGNASICSYMSESKALSAVKMSYGYGPEDVKAERILETLESIL